LIFDTDSLYRLDLRHTLDNAYIEIVLVDCKYPNVSLLTMQIQSISYKNKNKIRGNSHMLSSVDGNWFFYNPSYLLRNLENYS